MIVFNKPAGFENCTFGQPVWNYAFPYAILGLVDKLDLEHGMRKNDTSSGEKAKEW